MRLKKSLEEAVCILLILAKEEGDNAVKSYWISQQLGVSDSYLKKILRKLVLNDVITSTSSKGGGFKLARPIESIYMIDVYYAIEGNNSCVQLRDLANHVFSSSNAAQTVNDNMSELFNESEQSFLNQLANYPLVKLMQ
ncbi:MAG: Rrf2 family transcriptional regulator [Tetragenococcus koreensis]|nr:Rrf2 family transcriptional regulator [Tetragenococcus koreensis]